MADPYRVCVLLAIGSPELRKTVQEAMDRAPANDGPILRSSDQPVMESEALIGLDAEVLDSPSALEPYLEKILAQSTSRPVVVVSDEVVTRTSNRLEPTELTRRIRSVFRNEAVVKRGHLCAVVGLTDRDACRTSDVDRVVSTDHLDESQLWKSIVLAANAMWLKSPHSLQHSQTDADAIRVRLVDSKECLRKCLQLRHQVYDMLGYLDDQMSMAPSGLEMDVFDQQALQIVAEDVRTRQVVGTSRLVMHSMAPHLQGVVGRPFQIRQLHGQWCHEIANEVADPIYRRILSQPLFLPLPILNNSDFGQHWPQFLEKEHTKSGGEISRVVVAPGYQGLGISRLMMRFNIAVAFDVRRQMLLLECIPNHVAMYARYGFEPLPGHHCRAQGLDQIAVGMRLSLEDNPFNVAAMHAKRDLVMLSSRKQLPAVCLCNHKRCWSDAKYEWRGRHQCPLRDDFATSTTLPLH